MTRAIELQMQRRQTDAFIAADPIVLTLDRKAATTKTSTGGFIRAEAADPPEQIFRLLRAGLPETTQSPTIGGVGVRTTDLLVGRWDADMEEGDLVIIDGQLSKLTEVAKLPYRTVASVVLRDHRG